MHPGATTLPANCPPQIIREFEGHLRAVAAERDAALAQIEGAEAAQEEAGRRLREAERQEVRGGSGVGEAGRHELACMPGGAAERACMARCGRRSLPCHGPATPLPRPCPVLPPQAYNARRQADLDALQAEADGVVAHLREQQRALAAREREAAARDKAAGLR